MAVYYVSSLAIGGGNGSLGSPWTLLEAATNALANDEIRIMANGTYLPTAPISQVAIGDYSNSVIWIGVNSSGVVDGTKAVISGSNLPANNDIFYFNGANQYFRMQYLDLSNSPRYGIYFNNTVFGHILNCNIHNMSTGIDAVNSSPRLMILQSFFYNCSAAAIGSNSYGRVTSNYISGCKFVNNGIGLYCGQQNRVDSCIFVRNGYAVRGNSAWIEIDFSNNTFYGSTNDAILFYTSSLNARNMLIKNNIFRNNGGYALKTNNGLPIKYLIYNNCFSNNTSGDCDISGYDNIVSGNGNIHDNPLFISETNGSEDLRLQQNSPCINVGFNPCEC